MLLTSGSFARLAEIMQVAGITRVCPRLFDTILTCKVGRPLLHHDQRHQAVVVACPPTTCTVAACRVVNEISSGQPPDLDGRVHSSAEERNSGDVILVKSSRSHGDPDKESTCADSSGPPESESDYESQHTIVSERMGEARVEKIWTSNIPVAASDNPAKVCSTGLAWKPTLRHMTEHLLATNSDAHSTRAADTAWYPCCRASRRGNYSVAAHRRAVAEFPCRERSSVLAFDEIPGVPLSSVGCSDHSSRTPAEEAGRLDRTPPLTIRSDGAPDAVVRAGGWRSFADVVRGSRHR